MKKSSKNIIFLSVLILATILILFKSQKEASAYQSIDGLIFGTVYHITYQSTEELKPSIDGILQKFNHSLSPFDSTSVISKVNRNEETVLDNYFTTVFNRSLEISELTDGAFDITVSPFINVWGFGFKEEELPDSTVIDSLMHFVGYQKIKIEDSQIKKEDERMTINASAIAKGYAVDVIADFLNQKEVDNYMIEIGGEIVAKGVNAKKEKWRIGINKPNEDSLSTTTGLQIVLELENKAVATSGNYRNYYYRDGIRYAHTIDPRTGHPVQHEIMSATIVATDCMTADALATSCMVLGLDKSKELLDSLDEVDGFLIYMDKDGEVREFSTRGMDKHIVVK